MNWAIGGLFGQKKIDIMISHFSRLEPPVDRGDRPDPRGGIRWIIPEKADYWSGRGK
jgi:hypothetical protein